MRGELGAALVASDPSVKAKRSKATPVVQRAPSMRADAKLGDIMSLESAKLRAADKNRMCQVIFRATALIYIWSLLTPTEASEHLVTGSIRWEMVARDIFNRFGWRSCNRIGN
nr:uncharacterized protein LOC120976610 isoform X1 [Aegilops tauschii subsp. strangulata]